MKSASPHHPRAVLDPAALDQLRALQRPGRPSLIERVIALFVEEAPRQVETMRTTTDHQEFRRAAHTLKSNAANLGATDLRSLAEAVEQDARSEELETARRKLDALSSELERTLDALEEVSDS